MPEQLSFAEFGAAPPTDSLFLALFPDAAAATRAAELAHHLRTRYGLNGKPLPAGRLHVSLLDLGEYAGLPKNIVATGCAAAAGVAAPPFDVSFDRAMSFSGKPGSLPLVLRGNGVVQLTAFQRALGVTMQKAGLGRAKPQYTPHMTLLYGERRIGEQPVETIEWTVREFVLVHSRLGQTKYLPLGRWALRG
jgi:2'-5' RNA ligase